jgi:DNA-binding NtrC family response regulator
VGKANILIIDDEKNILSSLSRALRLEGYDSDVAGCGKLGLDRLGACTYDLVLLDVKMPDIDGLEVLRRVREGGNQVPVLMMSGHGTVETAVQATKLGAHDFIEKPLSTDKLLITVENILRFQRLQDEAEQLRRRVGATGEMIGESRPMKELAQRVQLAASAQAPVLIIGESGTGKELVARAIHQGSKRTEGPYTKINCAAVPSELIESELFGHEAGSFTGATRQRRGKFEQASTGTLFMDEVGDMPAAMQAKLLRVLQEGELERVGGAETIRVDVRVVAATNKNLEELVAEGRFRGDLYYRLNVVPIRVPPLRERREDIPLLIDAFVTQACEANDRRRKAIAGDAADALSRYHYPGNVRELKNLIERLVILTPGDAIGMDDVRALLPLESGGGGSSDWYVPGVPLRQMVATAERALILKALEHHDGHITRTASDLQIERSHLYKKMRSLDIPLPSAQDS